MLFKKKKLNIDSVLLSPTCRECGSEGAHIEIVAPSGYPESANEWRKSELASYEQYRDFSSHYLLYSGPGGSNGLIGDTITEERVALLKSAFTKPFDKAKIKAQFYDMAGYCIPCESFYCTTHWNSTSTGGGTCPQGHTKSLDPHWSPESS